VRAATLKGVDLSNANLSNADFTGANLTGAIMRGAILSNTTFHYTVMPDGSCLISEGDEQLERPDISFSNLAAYTRLAHHLKSR